jgi:endoglucanase
VLLAGLAAVCLVATLVATGSLDVTAATTRDAVNPLRGERLHVNPHSKARRALESLAPGTPESTAVAKIAAQPQTIWLGSAVGPIRQAVREHLREAGRALAVFTVFNRPDTDCGQSPAVGAADDTAYLGWIRRLAAGIGNRKAVVILEPDGIALAAGCPTEEQIASRLALFKQAVSVLKERPRVTVYLDAGHARWVPARRMAAMLTEAGLDEADGFSLNVSNFVATEESIAYGREISKRTRGAHFVIDVGRNGNGSSPANEWCNPVGRALGRRPTTSTGEPLVDAFLWIKPPGESDGDCNGGPPAGHWWLEYAVGLAQRARW